MKTTHKTPFVQLLTAALVALAAPAVLAGTVTISSTPLATSGASSVLPNLLFTLDASGSMDSDYLPDYINDGGKCMTRSGGNSTCTAGDPPWNAGGANGFNGVAYDPMLAYKPGLLSTGRSVVGNSTAAFGSTLTTTAVPNDAYGVQFTGTTNITTGIQDTRYCNANSLCKRNGADSTGSALVPLVIANDSQGVSYTAGQFPYKTHGSNDSTIVFGLPEMMQMGTFSRSGAAVTVNTLAPHGLAVGNTIFVTGTGVGSMDLSAVTVATAPTANQFTYTSTASGTFPTPVTGVTFTRSGSRVTVSSSSHGLGTDTLITVSGTGNANIDSATPVQITSTGSNSFTYNLSGSATVSPSVTGNYQVVSAFGSFRKHSAATVARVAGSTTVTVTSTAHGLVTNDIILINSPSGSPAGADSSRSVTVVNANTFTYTQTGGTTTVINTSPAATWVRTGLYNQQGTANGPANSYYIIPVEYCSDANLSNCVGVLPGAAAPSGFPFPARVRFCQTQEQALAPAVISDASGTPRCRSKFVGSGGTLWTWPRYGVFKRDILTVASYARSATRTDCSSAPTCTFAEENQNYARWWAYYRTRMQMMKTAAGRAFLPFISNPSATPAIPDKLRIGFITINPFYAIGGNSDLGTVQTNRYLKISAFNTTQAAAWYTMFYLQDPNQSTPLREALSRAGWIYAGKLNTGLTSGIPVADDPVQASCQRHFTLMTTDGYWNGNAGQNLQGGAIGNLDNISPTTDAGYSSVSVDRTTTGTFDGGVGTSVTVATPTTQLEQVICQTSNNTTYGSAPQTSCGCSAGQHRIKQRTLVTTQTVVTIDGVVTSNTTGSPVATYQNTTGCVPVFTSTAVTPATRLDQQVCTGSANTTFSQGTQQACGCAANLKRVKQQTGSRNHTVVTTDGAVTSDTYSAYAYTFQDITACNALVNTTVTEITEQEDNRCSGSGNTTFGTSANNGAGGETACGCTGGNRRNWRRTIKYDQTVVKYDGVTTSTTYGAIKSQAFAALTGCTNPSSPSSTPVINASSPQPATYPQISNSGSTVTSANFTLTPTPQIFDPAGATVTTPAGTQLTIALAPNPSNPTVGTPVTTTVPGGFPNTLADVAMYYFRNDLRGGVEINSSPAANTGPTNNLGGTGTVDVSPNLVPAKLGAKDFATHQHMVTFTVGMADGLMRYQADYDNPATTTGDFANVKNGTSNACFWVSGTCNWPQPIADDASALDDLWHAAVNGRGQFYLALNADALSTGIQTALTAVNAQVAAAAASATSSPNVTQTDNQIFSTTYETNTWSGKVFAQTIDPSTGDVLPTIQWQADQQLLSKVGTSTDSRVIWTFDSTSGTLLKPFTWAALTPTEQAFFLAKCTPASTMTQCTGLTTAQLATANDGASLVGFLRGQLGNEATIFRDRTFIDIANNSAVVQTVLGDTISAKPAYLRRPQFNYADAVTPTYSSFLTANLLRSPRVYVAANDGYLHSFNGDTGEEMWAYLPHFLMPGLYQLADTGYPTLHRYYADGSPELGEVFDTSASAWKSILVAGVAGGGRGFYALDVTDPSNPKGLWEFCSDSTVCAISDPDLGLSYGNAVIGKRSRDGRWVVLLTSGLNNITPGTGVGYFYVLDAITGVVLDKVATTAGTLATPSGLMKVSAFYDSALTDATFRYAYGGDQLGNVWRIDLSTNPPTVLHIATLTDGSTPPRAQPITTRPRLTPLNGYRVMFFGTGRYLGSPDLSDPGAASGISWQQTIYGFKDKDSDYGNLRTAGNLVVQTLTQASLGATDRTITSNPVNWNTKDGWYVDFNPKVGGVDTTPGEGVNIVDPVLIQGTVLVITNTPAGGGSTCSVGGSSNKYEFDFKTGSVVSAAAGGVVGHSLGGTITVGVAVVQLPSGAIKVITTGADTSKTTSSVNVSATGAAVRRFSYRVR